ncbi:MAG: hypothetical protein MUF61_02130 [archaeon]|jgi:hypothetical protein|nr:hypothetical protein [archaeon]
MAKKKIVKKKESFRNKFDKEAAMILLGIAVLVVVFLVFYFAFRNAGKVNYEGMTFVMERYGEIEVYHYAYLFNSSSGQMYEYNLYLRYNPEENKVPIEGGEIEFSATRTNYISINATDLRCEQTVIAGATLSQFMTNNMLKVKGATPNRDEAKANNLTYMTCNSTPLNNPVVMIVPGNETKVVNDKQCYTITVANCEILQAVEKFIVQSIIDAKERNSE